MKGSNRRSSRSSSRKEDKVDFIFSTEEDAMKR